MIVVSNTSPIFNLAKVGQLSLMPQLYGRILVSCAVHEELLDPRAGDTMITAVRSAPWIDIQSVQNQHSLIPSSPLGVRISVSQVKTKPLLLLQRRCQYDCCLIESGSFFKSPSL